MINKLKELMKKKAKEGKFVDDKTKKIKESMLDEIDAIANEKGASDLKGLKKVTVASNTEEGLKEGLDKAKEVMEAKEDMEEEDEDEEGKEDKMSKLKKLMEMASELKDE